ncbi:hypothetical protein HIM_12679 [Hirsutella minnesotensis 3608]|uniref:PNPLA domain-containing protein n=1 Tax=Hirsutella minnesotensis 3608 TaxID=1043627 RepID=A0A0F7ZVW5_9HYPO|nr:hypothetical protein HIM_12679 [Hirsutella minnesotensis 3608]
MPWLHRLYLACSVILTDSKYPSKNLDRLLRDEYGIERSILDYSQADFMGIKYGITLTTVGNSETVIATNYNGVGQTRGSTDYTVFQPKKGLRRIPLWEVMRCAIAAPFYFPAKHIQGEGTFQDGGLTFFNNPASIAVAEARATKGDPGIIVSLGTGFSELRSGGSFVDRLKAAFCILSDSRLKWEQLLSHENAGQRGEFYRFDIDFEGSAPSLDDVAKMDEVSKIAREAIKKSDTISTLANHLRAALFFFELDDGRLPQFAGGSFSCEGRVKCRLELGSAAFTAFRQQLQKVPSSFWIGERSFPIDFQTQEGQISRGEFSLPIRFRVSNRDEPFDILFDEGKGRQYRISGSPFTLQALIKMQKLEACFGTADHRKRTLNEHQDLRPKKRRRRVR